ncbi:MAG: energy transducer TonB [Planctomycetes bacterium]|nr:energy transducer TonB [Planctomycetota bacterium]MCB9920260.1 energy transducer TonB [Planctomycetota bacterium]
MLVSKKSTWLGRLSHGLTVIVFSFGLTLLLFFVLPVIQAITKIPEPDREIRKMDVSFQQEDAEEPEPEPEKEPEPEETQETPQEVEALDLSQLEIAVGASMGSGWADGGFGIKIDALVGAAGGEDDSIAFADLDQKPRATRKVEARMDNAMRRQLPGEVILLFEVDENGNVQRPRVQSASHDCFSRPALEAIRRWKFEPGKKKGKPVRSRMKLPMSFKKK